MYLGVEIGGTKLQLGVGAGDGTLAALWRGAVDRARGAEGIREQIVAAVPELMANAGVDRGALRGVGVGFGGPVDDATRTVITSHQVEGWDGFPLADWVSGLVGLPAVLGNDADVAGLAEALHGAGRGLSPVFYVTVGTGIGGGLIINGEIYRGAGRGAAEIGHLRVWVEGINRFVTLESIASGPAIAERATRLARHEPKSLLHGKTGITVQEVAEAVQRRDSFAWEMLGEAQIALAHAICYVIALLSPKRVVIGGGVSLIGEVLFFDPIRRMVRELVFAPFAECYDIVPAALGEEVVVHGAVALAEQRFR